MPYPIDPMVESLGLSMWRVHKKITSEMSLHKEIGLTVPQFGLLRIVAQQKQARVIQLAEMMDVKSSAVTVMLDRLEGLGMVSRVTDESDRRAVVVTITDKGMAVLKEGQYRYMLLLSDYLAILDPGELQEFARCYLMLEKQERV